MTEIRFADTTIRDGPQSLWANNMKTGQMLPVAEALDQAGFEAIEVIYIDPKKIVRELKEDPWERIRLLRERITRTPLRMITGRFKIWEISPPALWEMFMACHARAGVRQARISEDWNQVHHLAWKIRVAREVGMDPVINLIFSISPRHTDDYYAERARALAQMDLYRLCLKDPGGLLTPERMRTLVPRILENANGKEVELHSHCTTGLGLLNAIEAVKLGIRVISVGVPPLANGNALPNVFSLAANLRAMGYTTVLDEEVLKPVAEFLADVAEREGFPKGKPVEYDVAQYQHQVPGGMLSNLRHQLKLVGMEHKFEQTLQECIQVRADFGYPVMVTPLSQFVGSQAAINVIVGERYKEVTDQSIHYALGRWGGDECIEAMDPEVRARILDRPRARELAKWEPPQSTAEEIRRQYGRPGMSDEEMILRMEASEAEMEAMRAAGPPREVLDARQPLVALIRQLAQRKDRGFVSIQKDGVSITLGKKADSTPVGPR